MGVTLTYVNPCCSFVGYFTTLSAASLCSIECWDDRLIGNDSERSCRILIKVQSWHLPEGTEGSHKKTQSG
jgi:hypothetical protein